MNVTIVVSYNHVSVEKSGVLLANKTLRINNLVSRLLLNAHNVVPNLNTQIFTPHSLRRVCAPRLLLYEPQSTTSNPSHFKRKILWVRPQPVTGLERYWSKGTLAPIWVVVWSHLKSGQRFLKLIKVKLKRF